MFSLIIDGNVFLQSSFLETRVKLCLLVQDTLIKSVTIISVDNHLNI